MLAIVSEDGVDGRDKFSRGSVRSEAEIYAVRVAVFGMRAEVCAQLFQDKCVELLVVFDAAVREFDRECDVIGDGEEINI